jgi:ABC-type glycerol-3-phosphate transport system substrate-binding protein
MAKYPLSILLVFALALAGCAAFDSSEQPTPELVETPNITPTPPASAPPRQETLKLTLWLAPMFAPDTNTSAGSLLADRITRFEDKNPGVDVRVRIKEEKGASGLLESLSATTAVAPTALPDIIVLDASMLESAAMQESIIPLDEVVDQDALSDLFAYARQSAYVSDSLFGLPFASQAEVFVYRTEAYDNPPENWVDLLAGPGAFLFPAGDKEAKFTLGQYLASGGQLRDEEGRPFLNRAQLSEVLEFYAAAKDNGVLPVSVLEYPSAKETWDAFRHMKATGTIAPFKEYMEILSTEALAAIPLPTKNGDGLTLTNTWSWAIVTQDPGRQAVASDLILGLYEPAFLSEWTQALGFLPPTKASLSRWPNTPIANLADQLSQVAKPMPNTEQIAIFGEALQFAAEEVITGRTTPTAAAHSAVAKISRQ